MNIYVDGSGKGDFCFYIEGTETVKVEHHDGLTSNQAEYQAILSALLHIIGFEEPERTVMVEIYSDSQLVANQLNHIYAIRNDELRALARNVWELIELLMKKKYVVHVHWIPREQNKAGKILG